MMNLSVSLRVRREAPVPTLLLPHVLHGARAPVGCRQDPAGSSYLGKVMATGSQF